MERKINEKFTIDGKTYVTEKGILCDKCAFRENYNCIKYRYDIGPCGSSERTDQTSVNFKIVKQDKSMKEFNLEAAKAGKPVCTRDGHKVRILAFDIKIDDYPILAAVNCINGKEEVVSYTINGKYNTNAEDSIYDLMMVPKKKQGWIAIFSNNSTPYLGIPTAIYNTKKDVEDAIKSVSGEDRVVDIIQIEWEE